MSTPRKIIAVFLGIALCAAIGFFIYKETVPTTTVIPPPTYGADTLASDTAVSYVHRVPSFSLSYPKEFLVSEVKEDDGTKTVIFQGGRASEGFQVFVSPLKEETALSREAILSDFPELHATDIQEAITGDDLKVFIFFGTDPSIGKTREVWFTRGKYFYEVTSYASFDTELAAVMSTWRFR